MEFLSLKTIIVNYSNSSFTITCIFFQEIFWYFESELPFDKNHEKEHQKSKGHFLKKIIFKFQRSQHQNEKNLTSELVMVIFAFSKLFSNTTGTLTKMKIPIGYCFLLYQKI